MERGRYFFAEQRGRTFIKMKGKLKYTISSGFDIFIEKLLDMNFTGDLLFDLSEASYIDSTNLGLIARIANKVQMQKSGKVTIISNPDIYDILISVGFHRVFTIVDSAVTPDKVIEIADLNPDEKEKTRMLLKAHKALMSIDSKNYDLFKDVVEMLEKEL